MNSLNVLIICAFLFFCAMMLADAFHTYMDNKYGSKTNDLIDLQSEHEALQEQVDELQQQADDMQDQISNLIFQRDEIKQQQ